MKVRLNLKPGTRGTRKLVEQYGDKLVCVRYRYDRETGKRFKTAEIIVEEKKWTPQPAKDEKVALKIKWNEKELQEKIKNAGGTWDKKNKLWRLNYGKVKKLRLASRIWKI